ncbi:MAG: hypothetical protein BJ554DRAFT_6444 [Olpidium bornovanus]|uniref:Uncharacterized protein n=1 Tax=Olpidium bornovanus TaxID=278681 RepID=A0A8H8DK66_9FUNG|nr:MAG: hypothetical protein BJ554DRAFT_6444 [Olpidium bornovanus]
MSPTVSAPWQTSARGATRVSLGGAGCKGPFRLVSQILEVAGPGRSEERRGGSTTFSVLSPSLVSTRSLSLSPSLSLGLSLSLSLSLSFSVQGLVLSCGGGRLRQAEQGQQGLGHTAMVGLLSRDCSLL